MIRASCRTYLYNTYLFMRLLQIQAHGEFGLVEFFGQKIPRYAILSHTWGPDHEEVTFKDLETGEGHRKRGYAKLTFCGTQAEKDGLEFFWVDTCCIDKSSSAELSEAINSMFRWYHEAEKCYVYLSDVSTDSMETNSITHSITAIQSSKWFTRSWTLQELLAPRSVDFFSVEGTHLGERDSLVPAIQPITGIPRKALLGSPLSRFSVEERMSWAKERKAKREEDAAYSLLGIFDIHMPLIYGEGRQNAFYRLYREIEQSSAATQSTLPVRESAVTTSGNSLFCQYGKGSQFNAVGGIQNNNTGSGNQFSGTAFHGNVHFG